MNVAVITGIIENPIISFKWSRKKSFLSLTNLFQIL